MKTLERPKDLPAETVALVRLPVPVNRLSSLCQAFPGKDVRMHQSGDWIVITRERGGK